MLNSLVWGAVLQNFEEHSMVERQAVKKSTYLLQVYWNCTEIVSKITRLCKAISKRHLLTSHGKNITHFNLWFFFLPDNLWIRERAIWDSKVDISMNGKRLHSFIINLSSSSLTMYGFPNSGPHTWYTSPMKTTKKPAWSKYIEQWLKLNHRRLDIKTKN